MVLYGSEKEGVAGKGIRNVMKTKGEQKSLMMADAEEGSNQVANGAQCESLYVADSKAARIVGIPHPGCFGKRGCKPLKTKDRHLKKGFKRLQVIEELTIRGGATERSEATLRDDTQKGTTGLEVCQ